MSESRWPVNAAAFVFSACLALLVGAVALWARQVPVLSTYRMMFEGSLASMAGIEGSLTYTTKIAFTGLAAAIAFRARVWNIGGEGQLMMGAFGATLAALYLHLPDPIHLPIVILVGMACGALWGLVPAVLKVWLGVNEVLSSLMLNYVAILWVHFLVFGPWRDVSMGGFPYSYPLPESALLPAFGRSEVHVGAVIAVICAALLYVLFKYSRWGFETSVVGYSPAAARYAGMSHSRLTIEVMLLGGAIAALAGVGEVAGPAGRLYTLAEGYGYIGILVAWLARHNPIMILATSFFYGLLLQGGAALQVAGVEPSLVRMLQAAIILFGLASLAMSRYARSLLYFLQSGNV